MPDGPVREKTFSTGKKTCHEPRRGGRPRPPGRQSIGGCSLTENHDELRSSARTGRPGLRRRRSCQAQTHTLQLPPPLHRLEHGDFVGVFDVAADRNPHRDPRHLEPRAPQLPGKISRGSLAFDRRDWWPGSLHRPVRRPPAASGSKSATGPALLRAAAKSTHAARDRRR